MDEIGAYSAFYPAKPFAALENCHKTVKQTLCRLCYIRSMDKIKNLLVLTTGGTIDAAVCQSLDEEYHGVNWAGKALLHLQREGLLGVSLGKIRIHPICEKFSDDMTIEDWQKIAATITEAEEQSVVITTGTNGMPENARKLAKILEGSGGGGKNVVLTGALLPLTHGCRSDGERNLIDAVEVALNNTRHGVSIVMHRQVFDPSSAQKSMNPCTLYEDRRSIVKLP